MFVHKFSTLCISSLPPDCLQVKWHHFNIRRYNTLQEHALACPFCHVKLRTFFSGATAPGGPGRFRCWGFEIILRHTTLDRTPPGEWSDRRTDLYLTTHNTHNRQTSVFPTGFKTRKPSKRATADLRLRPRDHRDRCGQDRTAILRIALHSALPILKEKSFLQIEIHAPDERMKSWTSYEVPATSKLKSEKESHQISLKSQRFSSKFRSAVPKSSHGDIKGKRSWMGQLQLRGV